MLNDRIAATPYFAQERSTETAALEFVVLGGVVEILLGKRVERDIHFRRARASRSTSAAGRPFRGSRPTSHRGAALPLPTASRSPRSLGPQDSEAAVPPNGHGRGERASRLRLRVLRCS